MQTHEEYPLHSARRRLRCSVPALELGASQLTDQSMDQPIRPKRQYLPGAVSAAVRDLGLSQPTVNEWLKAGKLVMCADGKIRPTPAPRRGPCGRDEQAIPPELEPH
jgi:hypothetical protein